MALKSKSWRQSYIVTSTLHMASNITHNVNKFKRLRYKYYDVKKYATSSK